MYRDKLSINYRDIKFSLSPKPTHNLRTSKTHVRIQIIRKHYLKCIGTTIITLYFSERP